MNRERNPTFPQRDNQNHADCNTCGNRSKLVIGPWCTEYRIEPEFDCRMHTQHVMHLINKEGVAILR